MLSVNIETCKRSQSQSTTVPAPTNPPVIITPVTKPSHPVFGNMPEDFSLAGQPLIMLAHWHRKAMAVIDVLPDDTADAELADACRLADDIYSAALSRQATCASDVVLQMECVVAAMEHEKSDIIEEYIDGAYFKCLTTAIKGATAPRRAKKAVGKLARGRKLTRAGLLFRYQAFLIHELHTLSLEMYGDARHALQYLPFDDAVQERCANRPGNYAFLDPRALMSRAKSVLKSMKIDTERADDRTVRISRG